MLEEISNSEASLLKLHLLSEGISYDDSFLKIFAQNVGAMEKRRAYNNSDDRYINRQTRTPQEIFIADVVIAVNHKHGSRWKLGFRDERCVLIQNEDVVAPISFAKRPKFFDLSLADGTPCARISNLYGGASLAYFTPAACYYFNTGHECRFCSLKPNRDKESQFVSKVTPQVAAAVLRIALEHDSDIIKQIMLVGGNNPNYDEGLKRHFEIAAAIDEEQRDLLGNSRLETHIATMPPYDFTLLNELNNLNARITMNVEVFDDILFETICPGKAQLYGRKRLLQSLEYAANVVSGNRVHTILIAGLEPIISTIAGIRYFASIGVTPIVNVFHNDLGSHYEHYKRSNFDELLEVAIVLQEVYREYKLTPYWKGCGRNALDYEALNGWFATKPN